MNNLLSIVLLLTAFTLSAGEISLYDFKGTPGSYFTIQDLHVGQIDNNDLAAEGVELEITELDREAGKLKINAKGDAEKINSIQLAAVPTISTDEITTVNSVVNTSWSGKTTIEFSTNTNLGPDAHLRYHPVDRSRGFSGLSTNFGPQVELLVKGEQVPRVTRYRVELKEAKDDTGIDVCQAGGWRLVDRRFMWLGERFSAKPHPETEIKASFSLAPSPRNATKIKTVAGELVMVMDKTHQLSLDLAKGKLKHPELTEKGIEIEVTTLENGTLELTYSETEGTLLGLHVDPRKQSYTKLNESSRMEAGKTTLTCTTDLPLNEKTGLLLTIVDSSEEIRVPFELKDLALVDDKKPAAGTF